MTEFKLPELGENIAQGDLVRLMIAPGASVVEGQPVMELETDKAVVEVPSSISGTVKEVRVKEGEKVKVGQVIFIVENGAAPKARAAEAPAPAKAQETRPSTAIRSRRSRTCAPASSRPTRAARRHPAQPNSSFRNWARTSRRVIWCG